MSGPNPQEGLCLRYPEVISVQATITYEIAISTLVRATSLAQHTPFVWGYIDKPSEGQMYLIYLTTQLPFPPDGIRYQDQEQKAIVPVGGGRELEVMEVKYGFVPSQDTSAWRVRRRFRLHKGGHPQLVLIHYGRGPAMSIMSNLNQPVRAYPLRTINEPAVFVMGTNVGKKVFPNGNAPGTPDQQAGMGFGGGMGMPTNRQALLAQQNSNLEALERRNQRDRSNSLSTRHAPPQSRIDDDDSADESDTISTRTLALARYKRNHEFMNEVFMFAAFGRKKEFDEPPSPFSIFDKADLEAKVAKLTAEVEELKAKADARRDTKAYTETRAGLPDVDEPGDVSMDSIRDSGEETAMAT